MAIAADVTVEADVQRLFAETTRELGPVTALVNNAGILEVQMRVSSRWISRAGNGYLPPTCSVRSCARARPSVACPRATAARAARS